MNLPLSTLRHQVTGQASVYCYIIASVENRDGRFVQVGCGPNFQGDVITLCTCKHYMRTFQDADDWQGKWIAGFTGSAAGEGTNFLVYLMRIAQAYSSHYDLWLSSRVSKPTKLAKAVHLSKFGDLYEPRRKAGDVWHPGGYIPPRNDHCHAQNWDKDVGYTGPSGRPAALLMGDPHQSFLWNHPSIYYPSALHRGQKKCSLAELLGRLKAEGTS